jgi:hypothetical protein
LIGHVGLSQILPITTRDRAAYHPVEGFDQVRLTLRLAQRRQPRR